MRISSAQRYTYVVLLLLLILHHRTFPPSPLPPPPPGKAAVTALAEAEAKWRERYQYEVKTSVTVGTPRSETFDEHEEDVIPRSTDEPRGGYREEGRKGSIVSVTTLTQHYESASSPRFPRSEMPGDDILYAGIEEPPMERGLLILAQIPLTEVIELEQDGPCPKNYDKVDRIHNLILRLAEETPAYLRLINPDRRWDNHPDCSWWLQSCRFWIHPLQHFNFIALHRPYVFNRQESRAVALRASIDTLQAQMEMFQSMDSKAWRNFLLFFGSFDAVVLMASIYILFPKENVELASTAMQQFHWTQERFEAIADRNRLANSARGVLQAIYKKFRKANGFPEDRSECIGTFIKHLWAGKQDLIKIAIGQQIPGMYLEMFHKQMLAEKSEYYLTEEQLMSPSWANAKTYLG
ncbi:hypothetical protein BN1708_016449, partial [Verticillium longisporum]